MIICNALKFFFCLFSQCLRFSLGFQGDDSVFMVVFYGIKAQSGYFLERNFALPHTEVKRGNLEFAFVILPIFEPV